MEYIWGECTCLFNADSIVVWAATLVDIAGVILLVIPLVVWVTPPGCWFEYWVTDLETEELLLVENVVGFREWPTTTDLTTCD